MRVMIVTGAAGLIGSATARYFLNRGWYVHGIDNNTRESLFGRAASVKGSIKQLTKRINYYHHLVDIRDREAIQRIVKAASPDAIVHCAAQPSHDKAAEIPFEDFEINAVGTLNLLESFRQFAPGGVFVHMSTNKVYGDRPNRIELVDAGNRLEFPPVGKNSEIGVSYLGVTENMPIDNSLHSLFGASKLSADILAQEYGKYFDLNVGVFRGGCLTGANHAGVELHGFLSYIVKCAVQGEHYTVFGHEGKQVRDQIHSSDVSSAFASFIANPKKGEVYNIGGERKNSASILETIELIEEITGNRLEYSLSEKARKGDHKWYITDMTKFRKDYPHWKPLYSLPDIISEIAASIKAEK